MQPREFRAALSLRLLIPLTARPSLTRPSKLCQAEGCQAVADCYGYHTLSCQGKGCQFIPRHDILKWAIADLARKAGFHPEIEANVPCLGYSQSGGSQRLRPADVLIDGDGYQRTCFDVTVTSPLSAAKSRTLMGRVVGKLAVSKAVDKCHKHLASCSSAGYGFTPFAVDVCGIMEESGYHLIERFATRIADYKGYPFYYALSLCLRRISFAVQLGIARQLSPLLRPTY